MKKIKKILAALLTLVMVLGMSMTTFAVEQTTPTSDIKVSNLAEGVATDLELHKIIYLDKKMVLKHSHGNYSIGYKVL